jgi:hypothetical protein
MKAIVLRARKRRSSERKTDSLPFMITTGAAKNRALYEENPALGLA